MQNFLDISLYRKNIYSLQQQSILRLKLTVPIFQNNNESESVYTSHVLKDPNGRVVCPALYVYVCPICNNTGHQVSHTKFISSYTEFLFRFFETLRNTNVDFNPKSLTLLTHQSISGHKHRPAAFKGLGLQIYLRRWLIWNFFYSSLCGFLVLDGLNDTG